jgi:branched-chain amino acid transport system permease protein
VLFLQVLVNGLLSGGLYASVAIGFSVIWGVMNLINLAHGSMVILGAYITYYLNVATGVDPFLTIPISGAALFVFGYLVQKYLIGHVIEASVFMMLILTFGLDMFLTNMNLRMFTADVRSITPVYAGLGIHLGSLRIPYTRLGAFFFALLLTLVLYLFMKHTRLGNAIKATSFDSDAAGLVGVNVHEVYALTFGLGACLAGMAGSLISVMYSFSPIQGAAFAMKSFVVVLLGGLGSIPGAIAGGLILGLAENLSSVFLEASYKDFISFVLLVVILVIRPRAMFGKQFYADLKA